MIDATVTQMLGEHARGDTYRVLGERYGYSHEGVRKLLIREGTRMVNEVEVNLYLASKQEQMGREAKWPTFLVPHQEQSDWQTALGLFQWIVDRLKARAVHVQIRSRPTSAGTAFQLVLGGPTT